MIEPEQRRTVRRLGAALFFVIAVPLWPQTPAVDALLDGVAARLRTTASYENWIASP